MQYENFGPVVNPDGTPSDITRAMLAGTGRDPVEFAGGSMEAGSTIYVSAIHARSEDQARNYVRKRVGNKQIESVKPATHRGGFYVTLARNATGDDASAEE